MTPFTKVLSLSSVDLTKIQQALYGLAQLCLVVSHLVIYTWSSPKPWVFVWVSASQTFTLRCWKYFYAVNVQAIYNVPENDYKRSRVS